MKVRIVILLWWLQGITTYEYVVAVRAQSEPPGPSIDAGDEYSQPPSPASSAVTAASGRSSLGLSIQYRGASLCTPPNIFMDQNVIKNYNLIYLFSLSSFVYSLFLSG